LSSVVVSDLDMEGVPVPPNEADPPLVVESDAVLPLPVALQCFQAVAWRNTEGLKGDDGVEEQEFSASGTLDLWRQSLCPTTLEEVFGLGVSEGVDHD